MLKTLKQNFNINIHHKFNTDIQNKHNHNIRTQSHTTESLVISFHINEQILW